MAAATKTDAERLADALDMLRKKNSEIIDLKRNVDRLHREEDTAEKIREEIFQISQHCPKPPAWISGKAVSNGERGGPVCVLSDIHYGERINPEEINHVNEYNTKIAAKRIQRFTETTIDLCTNHMGRAKVNYPGMVLCLGGDMIGGDIHEELLATNEKTPHQSVDDLTDLLAGVIDRFGTAFGRVFVPCVVGNHGRSTKKMRMKGRVFTNYDWSIYCNLKREFRKSKNIQFMVPNDADAYFEVYGHRYLLTHGDSLGVKGGDGIIGAIGPIVRGSLKVHRSEAKIGRDFDTLVIGHWHQYITLPGLIVNNAVKGYDEYAKLALRAEPSRPSQALWFTHPEHGITAHWQVYLEGRKKAERANPTEWLKWAA